MCDQNKMFYFIIIFIVNLKKTEHVCLEFLLLNTYLGVTLLALA